MDTVAIVIADCNDVFRLGLRTLLEEYPEFRVSGEATSLAEAENVVKQLRPAVLLLNLLRPDPNMIQAIRRLKKTSPKTGVIILSSYKNEFHVLEAFKNGASGYVLKESSVTEIVNAVKEVIAGRRFLSPALADLVIKAYTQATEKTVPGKSNILTGREREVLQMSAEGYKNAEIAEKLSISMRTVEVHRFHFMRKLKIRNQTELVRYAVKTGIIALQD